MAPGSSLAGRSKTARGSRGWNSFGGPARTPSSTHVSGISAVRPAQALAFYAAMQNGGFAVDELGVSYYPTSSQDPRRIASRHSRKRQAPSIANWAVPCSSLNSDIPPEECKAGSFGTTPSRATR